MSEIYVDSVLHAGRPEPAGRDGAELRCYDLLDSLGVEYLRADHDPVHSIEDCQAVERVIGVNICKNLFLCNRQKTRFYLLLMPGLKPFKTRVFSKLIGSSRLSFADEEHMAEYLGCRPGSVSLLGLMNDGGGAVTLVIDADIAAGEFIRCHPCRNTSTLKLATRDVLEKLLPAVGHAPVIVEQPWNYDGDDC